MPRTFLHVTRRLIHLTIPILLATAIVRSAAGQVLDVERSDSYELNGAVTTAAFSGDGSLLIAGDDDGTLLVRDILGAKTLATLDMDDEIVYTGVLSGDSLAVVITDRGAIRLLLLEDFSETRITDNALRTKDRPVHATLDAGRRYLAVATRRDRIELFDLASASDIGIIDARDEVEDIVFLEFERLGRQLLAISSRGEVVSWSPVTLRPLRQLSAQGSDVHGSQSRIHAASTTRASNIYAVGLEEVALPRGGLRGQARPGQLVRSDLIIAYDWSSGLEVARYEYTGGEIHSLVLGPGVDHAIVVGSDSENLSFIDLRGGSISRELTVDDNISLMVLSDDQSRLAVGTSDGGVFVWTLDHTEPTAAASAGEDLPGLSGRIRIVGESDPILTPGSETTLAILPFDDRGVSENIASVIADVLTTSLANTAHLRLVERLRIDELLRELELQSEGITEEAGLEIGAMLNADFILLGSIGAFGSTRVFTTRLLDVETSEVVSGRQVVCEECRDSDLFDALDILGSTIAR